MTPEEKRAVRITEGAFTALSIGNYSLSLAWASAARERTEGLHRVSRPLDGDGPEYTQLLDYHRREGIRRELLTRLDQIEAWVQLLSSISPRWEIRLGSSVCALDWDSNGETVIELFPSDLDVETKERIRLEEARLDRQGLSWSARALALLQRWRRT